MNNQNMDSNGAGITTLIILVIIFMVGVPLSTLVIVSVMLHHLSELDTSLETALVASKVMKDPHNVINNGYIKLRGNKIVEVGKADNLVSSGDVLNYRGFILSPGLIDMHSHLEMIGLPDNVTEFFEPVSDYTDSLREAEYNYVTPEFVYRSMHRGLNWYNEQGITTIFNVYYYQNESAKVCQERGFRCINSEYIVTGIRNPTEGIQFQILADALDVSKDSELTYPGIAPLSPRLTSGDALERSYNWARKNNTYYQIHLGIVPDQTCPPMPKNNFASFYINEICDIDRIDNLIYTPRSTLRAFGRTTNIGLIDEVRTASLGTDGYAVYPPNLREDAKAMKETHGFSPERTMDMMTVKPAKGLGLNVGELKKGRLADFIVTPLNRNVSTSASENVINVYPQETWINGIIV